MSYGLNPFGLSPRGLTSTLVYSYLDFVVASDNFSGTLAAPVGTRRLNNAFGSSLNSSTFWETAGSTTFFIDAQGRAAVANQGAGNIANIAGVKRARVLVNPNGGADNVLLMGGRTGPSVFDGFALLLVGGASSLRISTFVSGSRTDHASLTVAARTNPFWLELEADASTITVRILNENLTIRDTLSFTFGSPVVFSGNYWGFAFYQDGATASFDNFIAFSSLFVTAVSFYRALSDVTTTGWTGTTSPLANAINETVLDRASNITSPDLATPITFALTTTMPAGTFNSRIDVKQTAGNAEVRLVCLNDADVIQGTSAWQALTATDTTYTLPITTTGASTRFRIEVR